MARLKRSGYELGRMPLRPWLTDRIRDGAIETASFAQILLDKRLTDRIRDGAIETRRTYLGRGTLEIGLPIGFAMARLKRRDSGFHLARNNAWLTDRIRDGAIETP